jgi:hypothetical protein
MAFTHVAMALGAYGCGNTEEEAVKNMKKAYGRKADLYIVFQSSKQNIFAEGENLCMNPPEGGWKEDHIPFEGIIEKRYRKGKLVASGFYGQTGWPKKKGKS